MADEPNRSVLVLHGPNLSLLGSREVDVYGRLTLPELDDLIGVEAERLGLRVRIAQTNGEGAIIDLIHAARDAHDGIVINPGGYTHTSVAILDALRAVPLPVVEVHLTNLYAREGFRHTSITAAGCVGVISGLGPQSYLLALRFLAQLLSGPVDA
jgi:3-dehydroquinate dehydratase-2